jgi:hypothetical protein
MNAVLTNESNPNRLYLDQTWNRPAIRRLANEEKVSTSPTLFSAVNPEQIFAIQQNNWQLFPGHLFEQLKLRLLSNQRTAEDIAQHWHVQKSGAGFVIAFQVDALFLHSLATRELMGEHDYEYHISAATKDLPNKSLIDSIAIMKAFYSTHRRHKNGSKTPSS